MGVEKYHGTEEHPPPGPMAPDTRTESIIQALVQSQDEYTSPTRHQHATNTPPTCHLHATSSVFQALIK